MKNKNFGIKKIIFVVISFILLGTLFAYEKPSVDFKSIFALFQKKDGDIQALYNDMSDLIPAVVYLQPDYTSAVSLDFVDKLDYELKTQMVTGMTFKPVAMNKWLDLTYGTQKASSIYQLIKDLKKERYPVNLIGICKSYIYKIGKAIVIKVSLFPFEKDGYPVSAIRVINSEKEIKTAVRYILVDLLALTKEGVEPKIKLAIEPFTINNRTLIEQKTGEFDFIATSFSSHEGIEIKNTDDYFSELFAYQAQCTGMFHTTTTQNIQEYIDDDGEKNTFYYGHADYLVQGNIVLSNKLNIITIQLIDVDTGKTVRTTKHITKTLSLEDIWDFNYKIISDICSILYKEEEVKIIKDISNENGYFYMNGMFAGFDNIDNIPVTKGKTIIHTGTNFTADAAITPRKKNKDYYIYTNNDEVLVYQGREGEYVWNLLEK